MELPEKEAFRLKDVANRWKCSEHDLIDYCESRTLRIAIYVRQCLEGKKIEITPEEKRKVIYTEIQGCYYTSFTELLHVLDEFERNESVELAGWLPLCPTELIDTQNSDPEKYYDEDLSDETGHWLFMHEATVPGNIHKEDLRITKAELVRFEEKLKKNEQKMNTIPR